MDFRRLNDFELSEFAKNIKVLLAGEQLVDIEEAVRTELTRVLGTKPEDLGTSAAAATTAEATRKSLVSEKNSVRTGLVAGISQVRNALRAAVAAKDKYDLCGFDYPGLPSPYAPEDPSELSAAVTSNGVNAIKFKGNNKPGRVVYEIWRRHGDTAGWALHATTKRQTFVDTGVTPGQYYEYRVRAAASRSASNFSNSGVVYGVL